MNEIIRKDIHMVLKKVRDILRVKSDRDVVEIRELSNHTIHNCSIFQDEDSVSVAILIYALSKVIERKQGQVNYKNFLVFIQRGINLLQQNKIDEYRKAVKKLFSIISGIDSKLKMYVEEVIKQAEIKKGSKLYEHGLSSQIAASILGISQWELMNYIGKTNILDRTSGTVDIKNRLKFTRGLFS